MLIHNEAEIRKANKAANTANNIEEKKRIAEKSKLENQKRIDKKKNLVVAKNIRNVFRSRKPDL